MHGRALNDGEGGSIAHQRSRSSQPPRPQRLSDPRAIATSSLQGVRLEERNELSPRVIVEIESRDAFLKAIKRARQS